MYVMVVNQESRNVCISQCLERAEDRERVLHNEDGLKLVQEEVL